MMERMMSKGNSMVIEQIVDVHDVNDAIGKEFGSESVNNGKLPLFNETGKDGTPVETEIKASTSKLPHLSNGSYDNDFGVFESDNGFQLPWFAKRMNEKRAKMMNNEFEFRKVLAKIEFEFRLENSSQDSLELPNDVKPEQGMKDHLHDEFNSVMYDITLVEIKGGFKHGWRMKRWSKIMMLIGNMIHSI
nr:hypothetical protein [Tanacetum cinerariifolium]